MVIRKHTPIVSIIITTFNRYKYLKECIESIINQTYSNIEILVVDDGSQSEIAKKNKIICKQFSNCEYYFKINSGQPNSRNYGIKKAKGEYLAFCDDDDYWVLDKVEKQVAILEKNRGYGIVNCSIEYVIKDGKKTGEVKSHKGHNHGGLFNDFLIKNRTSSITPMLRKEIFEKVGYFNPNFTIAEDWEFWRRVSYYFKFYFIDEVLAYVRLHDDNMSLSRTETVFERYMLYRKLTRSLLLWGKERFSEKEKRNIEYIEWCHYRKLFTNNLIGVKKKVFFLATISNDIPKLLKLYFNYNIDYKSQN